MSAEIQQRLADVEADDGTRLVWKDVYVEDVGQLLAEIDHLREGVDTHRAALLAEIEKNAPLLALADALAPVAAGLRAGDTPVTAWSEWPESRDIEAVCAALAVLGTEVAA